MARWFILLPNLLVVFVLVGSVLCQSKEKGVVRNGNIGVYQKC